MTLNALHKNFQNPPDDCSQIPFWFLNDRVDGETYCQQIDKMANRGVKQAMPHPRFGMDRRDYLTDTYWKAMKKLLEHAKKIGTTIHLYDEFNWSSGPAGSRVTADPEMSALGLDMIERNVSGPTKLLVEGLNDGFNAWGKAEDVLGVCLASQAESAINLARTRWLDTTREIQNDSVLIDVPKGEWRLLLFYTVRTTHPSPLAQGNGGVIDYLSPEPTRRFIELTHDEYFRHLGEYFGSVIPSIFYDESAPYAAGSFTWTRLFPEEFQRRKGYDLTRALPALFFDCGDSAETIRHDYWDVLSTLFAENHIGQMAKWCEQHGIALTGHTYEEPERWKMGGDFFRSLRRQHWVCFDSLGGYKPYHMLKPVVGAYRVSNSNVLMCEALGLLGIGGEWKASPRLIRQAYNQLAFVGCTHIVPHAFFQSIDHPKTECPPCFFDSNYYWKYYDRINDLTARQCWMNRQTQATANIAILYPLSSWQAVSAGGKGRSFPWKIVKALRTCQAEKERQVFEYLVDDMVARQLDFDVIDDQFIMDASCSKGILKTDKLSYDTLVFPPMSAIRDSILKKLDDFVEQGGKLVFVEKTPDINIGKGRNDPETTRTLGKIIPKAHFIERAEDAAQYIAANIHQPVIEIVYGPRRRLAASLRKTTDGDCFFALFHQSDTAATYEIKLSESGGYLTWWDTDTGQKQVISTNDDAGNVKIHFKPWQMGYLQVGSSSPPQSPDKQHSPSTDIMTLDDTRWELLPLGDIVKENWACDFDMTEIQVPVFKTRVLDREISPTIQSLRTETGASINRIVDESQLWNKWFEPTFDDSDWETVHCLRGPLLYSDNGSRLFRAQAPIGAVALKLPLPIEKEYALYLNGELVRLVKTHEDSQSGWLEFDQAVDVVAIECSSMAPDFGLTAPLTFRCVPKAASLRSWTELNMPWYSGMVMYRRTVAIDDWSSAKRYLLDLGDVHECAEIWLNDELVGARLWPPYEIDISDKLHPGENDLRIIVSNLLANRFSWDHLGTRGTGSVLCSGLIGPVAIKCTHPVM